MDGGHIEVHPAKPEAAQPAGRLPGTNPQSVTLHIPLRFTRRGGHKELQFPDGAPLVRGPDHALAKALVRAFRWKRMLDSGDFATMGDLAKGEKISPSYLTRVLRLTLLAPDLVEAILDGRQGSGGSLSKLVDAIPIEWAAQRGAFGKG
jgi:hypothetical protein